MLWQIRGLQWSPDDRTLISCGLDGGVYEWLIDEGKRNGECVTKGHHYSSLLYTPDLKNILVVAADSSIKEISTKVCMCACMCHVSACEYISSYSPYRWGSKLKVLCHCQADDMTTLTFGPSSSLGSSYCMDM